ncbi:MAG: hypothetical protein RMJ51_05085 [Candidatus Calescibacterium sp.]|nr:hypothetical protein [Candidatus Calescibacterium sp.]MCX7972513.1 hypothetical protein [bacterium]MDW8195594.1 hypothetical protein [Candidatus Calescibacterium sp.]
MLKSLLITLIFTLIIIISSSLSQEYNLVGVVYKQVDNYFYGKVYVQLKKGDILDVYRSNQKVARVKIEQIDENKNVLLSVVEGQITPGDTLYSVFTPNITEIVVNSQSQPEPSTINLPYDKINDGLKYYTKVLSENTRIIKFGPNSNRPTRVVIDPAQLFMLYSQYENYRLLSEISDISNVASAASTFYLFNLLGNLWNTYQNIKGPQINTNVPDSFIQVIYLNEKLAAARTILHAYKEAIYDKNYLENYYRNLISSTNITDFHIFEVTVFNAYNQPLALSPFSYKVYLLADNGRRYKAIKYDASLDTAVPPGGTISGFIYFPKYDIQYNQNISSSRVRLSIEEIGPLKQEIVEFK